MDNEPIMDVAHLGHLELLTPKPEESLSFFVDVLGMTESSTPRQLGLPAGLGRLRDLFASAHGIACVRTRARGFPSTESTSTATTGEGVRAIGPSDRMARKRGWARAGLSFP